MQHILRHDPERPVELHVPVNPLYRTGMSSLAFGRSARQTALNQILLNALVGGPQVVTLILPAAWGKYL